jgi:excisionase family DNA binding protein
MLLGDVRSVSTAFDLRRLENVTRFVESLKSNLKYAELKSIASRAHIGAVQKRADVDDDRFLLISEVCASLRCAKTKVYQLVKEGKLEAVRMPGIRIEESELRAFIERSKTGVARRRRSFSGSLRGR